MNTAPAEMASSVRGKRPHQLLRVAAGEIEEHEIGRRVVEEARQHTGQPEIGGVDRVPSGVETRASSGANGPCVPARSIASMGIMVMKMAANRIATSCIGAQVKAFSTRIDCAWFSRTVGSRDQQRMSRTRPLSGMLDAKADRDRGVAVPYAAREHRRRRQPRDRARCARPRCGFGAGRGFLPLTSAGSRFQARRSIT